MVLKNNDCEYAIWDGSTESAEAVINLLSRTTDVDTYSIGRDGELLLEYDDGSLATLQPDDVVVYNEFWNCRIVTYDKFKRYFDVM